MITKENNITEGMFSAIDQIKQDSKDVRDFVKKVFADREFKKMSNDKDFIKYLKSIYEGTMIDEEHVKFSNRTQSGTITTGSVQTTNEATNAYSPKGYAKAVADKVMSIDKALKQSKIPFTLLFKLIKKYDRTFKFESVNEASIKGKNNKTGESFGMVIGSDKKNKQGEFEVTIRITYSSRISSYKFMFDKSSNLIAIKDYGYSMDGKFPDMSGRGSVKDVRPNPRETITQIAKITSPAFAKKIYQHVKKVNESVNEASKLAMGIAGFTGTRGVAVDNFIEKHNIDSKKLFNFVKKGNLKDRMAFVSAIAGKPSNKMFKMITKQFGEGKDDGVPQGYNPMVESKTKESKAVQAIYKYSPKEKKFYDKMAEYEKTIGPKEYAKFIINALRGFGINPRQFKRVPEAEEKIFQTLSQ